MPVLDGGGLVRNHHSVAERIFVDSGIVIDPVVARLERGFPAPGQELFTVDIDFGRPLIRFTVETGDLVVVLAVDPAAGKLGRSENLPVGAVRAGDGESILSCSSCLPSSCTTLRRL